MCGIVGYIGKEDAQGILLEGLKKLEYRGYDSAGIAVYGEKGVVVRKDKGRLSILEEELKESPLRGTVGIGHTRWATHGKPSKVNAHPQTDEQGRFIVVHNGIIENYLQLKEELLSKGHRFQSETDTEVIAHLLEELYDGNLVSTVQKAVANMRGAYALGVLSQMEPDKLIAVRLASPLIIGLGENENFIASDIPALLEYTRDILILEDGEMAVLTRNRVELMKVTGEPIARDIFHVSWDVEQAEKGGYDHYLIKEIHEQPRALRDTLDGRIDLESGKVWLEEIHLGRDALKRIERIFFVAAGTSYHAGLVGKQFFEKMLRIPVEVDIASEYRYRDPLVDDRTLVIVISQSGETADTLAALRESRKRGAHVIAITNVVGSSIAREADDVLYIYAGPEVSVASTKAYTSQLMAIYLLGIYMAQELGTQEEEALRQIVSSLQLIPTLADRVLDHEEKMKEIAAKIKDHHSIFFLGRGIDQAVAMEGSLKLKEISYIHSEAYPAGELKHGTLALIVENTPVIALATQEDIYEKMASNIIEVKARGAYVIGMGLEGNNDLVKSVDEALYIPRVHPLLTPILTVIPLQLIAYFTSVALGNDVDKPRNLAKSVTVE
ncbi:glutamine--fructose-6-phosphate transaminase (isomerizing) [Thermicanus aegyptius]|uniref:glutamine--fructose-6-phosphate transaminase (isomerizing) n=1 Tax=Thermicanus aegyptius TaxID=94009 RepID=UPI00041BEEF8|nr:glutamine--fructose-6-phosphate transaminase (isomerizing) [Thermicanus aegyptius]